MRRIILIIIGRIAIVLSTLGVVLPPLLITPFILLVIWCFIRSSPRLHDWLLCRPWSDGYLHHWQKRRTVPPGAKPYAILLILMTFGISPWLVNMIQVRGLLLIILACLLIFMWWIPVIDEKQ